MKNSLKRLKCALITALAVLSLLSGCAAQPASSPSSDETPQETAARTVNLPILLYHNIAENGDGGATISYSLFSEQMQALCDAGYETISFSQLVDFVSGDGTLPEKPVIITFDDGYLSNYELAYPLLREHDMKATIFIIGSSVGKSTYKDTDYAIFPHFSYEQASEMYDSGLIDIQSHTYDLHQSAKFEGTDARTNADIREGEDIEEFKALLQADLTKSTDLIRENVGAEPIVFSYPGGVHSDVTDLVVEELGFSASVIVSSGINQITSGDPDCLFNMVRNDITDAVSPEELIENILEVP